MAQRAKSSKLDTRSARAKLSQRREPYWCSLTGGLALGYRKGKTGGHWIAKHYRARHGRRYHAIGPADDKLDNGAVSFVDAQSAARDWLAELANPKPDQDPAGPYTVNRACDDYLAYLENEGRPESAIKDARYRIDAFIRPPLGAYEVAALQPEQLRRWRANLATVMPRLRTKRLEKQKHRDVADDRARKASANRILTVLKATLNHAFDEKRVASNTAWGRRVKPFEDVETARVRFLQVEEARRLVKACDAAFGNIVQAALQTGARYSELARLQVTDFDASAATVFVERSKGGKARHVRLSDEGVQFFRGVCLNRAGGDRMLCKDDGSAWLKSHQARPMVDACKTAKITPPIGFHGLRHTWASLLVKSGAPLHVVALNLGHVSKDGQPDVRMATRHYAHLEPSYVADMIRTHGPKFGFQNS
jgi:integrase